MTTDQDAAVALAELRVLRGKINRADVGQRTRLAHRFDLAQAARDAGATWTQINEAAGVANMQATVSGKRPSVD